MGSSYKKYEIIKRDPDPKTSVFLVIPNLLTTINLVFIPVIFTHHCHKSLADYGMLGEWWNNDLIIDGTIDSQLMPKIGKLVGKDEVVEKNTYSAFGGNTLLQERLLEMGVKEVIVAGVMTNLWRETTAREAFVRGFRVFFSTDAIATSYLELHEATLKNLAYGFAYLIDCQRLNEVLHGN